MFFDRLDRKKSHLPTPSPTPTATAVYSKTASLSVSRRREERGSLPHVAVGRYAQNLRARAALKNNQIRCGHGGGGVEEDGWIIVSVLGSKVALLGTSEWLYCAIKNLEKRW